MRHIPSLKETVSNKSLLIASIIIFLFAGFSEMLVYHEISLAASLLISVCVWYSMGLIKFKSKSKCFKYLFALAILAPVFLIGFWAGLWHLSMIFVLLFCMGFMIIYDVAPRIKDKRLLRIVLWIPFLLLGYSLAYFFGAMFFVSDSGISFGYYNVDFITNLKGVPCPSEDKLCIPVPPMKASPLPLDVKSLFTLPILGGMMLSICLTLFLVLFSPIFLIIWFFLVGRALLNRNTSLVKRYLKILAMAILTYICFYAIGSMGPFLTAKGQSLSDLVTFPIVGVIIIYFILVGLTVFVGIPWLLISIFRIYRDYSKAELR